MLCFTGSSETSTNVEFRTMTRYSRRMTLTAVVLSATYSALTFPEAAHYVWFSIHEDHLKRHPLQFHRQFMTRQMLGGLFHLNHAINFALYCLTSSTFRKEILSLLKCHKGAPVITSTTHTEEI